MISVILPVYNGERYLKSSIESVIKQKNVTFELIIINDASSDSSARILNEYKDASSVKIIHNDSNIGLFSSLNKAISLANGELIKLWAQDDIMLENCLFYFLEVYFRSKDSSFFWCNTINISGIQQIEYQFDKVEINTIRFENWDLEKVLRHFWYCGGLHGNISTMAFGKRHWLKVGGFNPKMIYSGDIDFTEKLLSISPPVCIPVELIYLRNHIGQFSKNVNALHHELFETLQVFENIASRTNKFPHLVSFADSCKRDKLLPYYTSNCLRVFRKNPKIATQMFLMINKRFIWLIYNLLRVKIRVKFGMGLVKL
jgi:glycosyltransferase involved in cell wall biosynthesis